MIMPASIKPETLGNRSAFVILVNVKPAKSITASQMGTGEEVLMVESIANMITP